MNGRWNGAELLVCSSMFGRLPPGGLSGMYRILTRKQQHWYKRLLRAHFYIDAPPRRFHHSVMREPSISPFCEMPSYQRKFASPDESLPRVFPKSSSGSLQVYSRPFCHLTLAPLPKRTHLLAFFAAHDQAPGSSLCIALLVRPGSSCDRFLHLSPCSVARRVRQPRTSESSTIAQGTWAQVKGEVGRKRTQNCASLQASAIEQPETWLLDSR